MCRLTARSIGPLSGVASLRFGPPARPINANVSWHWMRQLLLGQWFTCARALLIGGLTTVIFLANPQVSVAVPHILTAFATVAIGTGIGFHLAARPPVLKVLSKLGGHHYSLAGALGFVLLALWASEGGSVWPLALWFLPAGILEAFVSSIGRANAS